MTSQIKILFAGLVVSLLGALPLGVLNLSAFHLAIRSENKAAMLLSMGAIIVEVVYVSITLNPAFHLKKSWQHFLQPVLILVLLSLGIITLFNASDHQIDLDQTLFVYPFLTGLFLSAINPLQFGFWIMWNNIFIEKQWLTSQRSVVQSYLIGIGIGSSISFLIFILLGNMMSKNDNQWQQHCQQAIGFIYIVIALFLTYRYVSQLRKPLLTSV